MPPVIEKRGNHLTKYTPKELADHLKDGLLSFPVTPFTETLEVDENHFREHVAWQSNFDIAGLFIAGGTGEGFSLTTVENTRVVKAAVDTVSPDVPVLGSAGGSTRQAIELARGAQEAGAEGILLLPPYLIENEQQGLFEHVSAVIDAVEIAVIIYNRANAIYSAETVAKLSEHYENFIGFKDSTGDIEHLATVYARNGDRLFYLGGLPTAETYALALLQMGMSTYSSAIYNFIPEFALEFYRDVRSQNQDAVNEKLNRFILPYLEIRDRGKGFGVSIVKAGVRAVGREAGPVRPPLQDLSDQDMEDLRNLIVEADVARL